jgi:hypothetical protein
MIRRLLQARVFELQQVLDDVLAERLCGAKLALPQILDLLGDQLGIKAAVPAPLQLPQQLCLLLRPGVEIVVEGNWLVDMPRNVIRAAGLGKPSRGARASNEGRTLTAAGLNL